MIVVPSVENGADVTDARASAGQQTGLVIGLDS
jgi:hypothetical protein